jgi:hypothetical protein
LNNKQQLQLARAQYPMDHGGRLVPHGLNIPTPPQPELGLWWAQGFVNYEGGNSENIRANCRLKKPLKEIRKMGASFCLLGAIFGAVFRL